MLRDCEFCVTERAFLTCFVSWMLDAINGSNLTEESEIGIGYVPAVSLSTENYYVIKTYVNRCFKLERFMFVSNSLKSIYLLCPRLTLTSIVLGGSGLALASTSNKTEIAWNLIVQMIDPNQM